MGDGARSFVLRGGYRISYFHFVMNGWAARMRMNAPMNARFYYSVTQAAYSPDGIANYGLRTVPNYISGQNTKDVVQPTDAKSLAQRIAAWLGDPVSRTQAANAARETVEQQSGALEQSLVVRGPDLSHHTRDAGSDNMLHLHRFHDRDRLSPADGIADAYIDAHDRPRNGCADRLRAFRQRRIVRRRHYADLAFSMRQNGKRIDRIHFRRRHAPARGFAIQAWMLAGRAQRREVFLDQARVPLPADKGRRRKQIEQELPITGNAGNTELR
jgi:hypothetical protein